LLHTKKLTVLGLTLFVVAFAGACTQILGEVEVCKDQPDEPCSIETKTPPNLPGSEGRKGSAGDIVVQRTEPCEELDALRCNGPEFQRCSPAAQGLGWITLQACRTAELCMSGAGDQVAGCIAPACNAGQFTCNGAVLQSCTDDLTTYAVTDVCLSAAHCDKDSGSCKEVPCQPGETRCNDKALERCNADQTAWEPVTEAPCETTELCEVTRQTAAASCQPPICEAGAVQCDGSIITQCNAGRTAMEPIDDCQTAALCQLSLQGTIPGADPVCITPLCEVNEHRCDGANLLVCNPDRTELVLERTCAGPPFCNASMADNGLPEGSPGCLAAPCEPGQTICNGAQPAICRLDQTGFDPLGPACESRDLCIDDDPQRPEAYCRPAACHRGPGSNEFRCVGSQLQQCNAQLTSYDLSATCASAALCAPRAGGCITPTCGPGQRRCNNANGSVEVCSPQFERFNVESNCGGNGCRGGTIAPVCNDCVPGSGSSCTNGDILTCNGGVASASDCGASGCRATPQGPLCNQCTPGSPPACSGGDIVTCTAGVPSLQDCGAPGCRATTAGPACNQCVPGSAPTCTNGDIVACNAGVALATDCGAPGCRITQQGPVCNQCVPNSPPTCSNGDIVACNANGTPVVTDCGAPGCRNTAQGPVCNQCVVGTPSCNDGNACTSDVCSAPGTCSNPAAPSGTTCGGGNVCNGSGACVQCTTLAQCNDNNPSTTDACTSGACTHGNAPSGTACGSGNVCNASGGCVQCTTDAQCDDGSACTSDACSNGLCTHGNAASGTPCGSGNTCNGGGACVQCTTAAQCSDGNACTNDACEMATGTCRNPPAAAGTPCGPGLVCSANGSCVDCTVDADCGDGNDCTTDVCNTRTGLCVNTVSVGAACGGSGNDCNTSTCNVQGVCAATPNPAACDDRVPCTADVCTMTGCVSTPDDSACGPAAPCTAARCDPAQGCVTTTLDDGSACTDPLTGAGSCTAGLCVPAVIAPPAAAP
jgi:hypothetical protein